jgi:hypothetical protein
VVPNEAGYFRFLRQAVDVDSDIRGELALFAVDFTLNGKKTRNY